MSLAVEVGWLSGKTAVVRAGLDEEVGTLTRRAQTELGVGRGRLLDSSGSILDAGSTIEAAKLQDGDLLTLRLI